MFIFQGMAFAPLTLRRIEPARNMARFYVIDIQLDLFGRHSLIRNWGRVGTLGRVAAHSYETATEAEGAWERLVRNKRSRGYRSGGLSD